MSDAITNSSEDDTSQLIKCAAIYMISGPVCRYFSSRHVFPLIFSISLMQRRQASTTLIVFHYKDSHNMRRIFSSLFSSPESLLQVMSQQEIIEAVEDGDRIIIDQDGNASVNFKSKAVREDFLRHVTALKRA